MTLLTKEQIDLLTQDQARAALRRLHKDYEIDTPVNKINYETWSNFDLIVNCLLYLEDRIKYVEMTDHLKLIRHGEKPEEFLTNYG
jgi:hypothetical protein